MEYATLNTGAKMPLEGFGAMTMTAEDAGRSERTVYDAIQVGYRLIDTAAAYRNEDAVGGAVKRAVKDGICSREELFIVSKMWVQDMKNYDDAARAIDVSLKNLGLEYLDLYLEHQAMGNYFETWRAMEDAYKAGKLRTHRRRKLLPQYPHEFLRDSGNQAHCQSGGTAPPFSRRQRRRIR